MIFITKNSEIKNNAIEYIKNLNDSIVWDIEITKYKKRRSLQQSRLMWLWLNIISDETGNSADDLHEVLKLKFLGSEVITAFGTTFERPKSTTTLTTIQFTDYLDRIESLAVQCNIKLPHPAGIYEEAYGL